MLVKTDNFIINLKNFNAVELDDEVISFVISHGYTKDEEGNLSPNEYIKIISLDDFRYDIYRGREDRDHKDVRHVLNIATAHLFDDIFKCLVRGDEAYVANTDKILSFIEEGIEEVDKDYEEV